MKEDAQGTLLSFLRLASKSKDPLGQLTAIFGLEHAPKILRLINNLQRYEQGLNKVAKAENYQDSMQDEYNVRAQTTANNIQLLKNSIAKLGIVVGNVLLPPLNAVLGVLGPGISAVADFARAHQGLTTVLVGAFSGFVLFKTAMLASSYVASGVRSTMLGLELPFAKLRGALSATGRAFLVPWNFQAKAQAVSAGVASMRQSLLGLRASVSSTIAQMRALGPAGIAAGAGSIAAGAMARAGSVGLRLAAAGARSLGMAFRVALGPMSWLMMGLSFGVEYVMSHWDKIVPYFESIWENIKSIFQKATSWLSPVFETIGSVVDKLGAAWGWITGKDNKQKSASAANAVATKAAGALSDQAGAKQAVQAPETSAEESPETYAEDEDQVAPAMSNPAPARLPQAQSAQVPQPSVQVSMQFSLNGLPENSFAEGVVRSLREKQAELEQIIAGIVHNQARLAYGG